MRKIASAVAVSIALLGAWVGVSTKVGKNQVNGTGKYSWGRMGSYRNGPVTILLTGSNYRYTKISVTLTRSWYGFTTGSYPPYGHGAHHTTAHIRVAVNDPTTNLIRY